MMLFPYIREPATGSRMPSMSTGGAATNAVMKQTVAANRVGIISTPNQPTYRRLFVEVTHSQKLSQVDCDCCLERVVAIVLKKGYVIVRGSTEYDIPTLPSRVGIRDVFYLDSLGKDNSPVTPSASLRIVTFNIFIILRFPRSVKSFFISINCIEFSMITFQ